MARQGNLTDRNNRQGAVNPLSNGGLPALPDGQIWVGDASNVATAVTMSGDATISNTGVLSIGGRNFSTSFDEDGNLESITDNDSLVVTTIDWSDFYVVPGKLYIQDSGDPLSYEITYDDNGNIASVVYS